MAISPLQLIKNGIHTGDWKLVVKGYATLTGEPVEAPAAAKGKKRAQVTIKDVPDDVRTAIVAEATCGACAVAKRILDVAEGVVAGNINSLAKSLVGVLGGVQDRAMPTDKHAQPTIVAATADDLESLEEAEEPEAEEADITPEPPRKKEIVEAREIIRPQREDTLETKAREALDRRRTNLDQFNVEHGDAEQGKKYCKALPFQKPEKMDFIAPKANPRDDEISKKLTKGVVPSERREPVQEVRRVQVTCCECEGRFLVDEFDANKEIDGQPMNQTCPACIRKAVRS